MTGPRVARLTALVQEGVDGGAEVVIGCDGAPARLAELQDDGSRYFSSDADAPAIGVVMSNDRATLEVLLGAIACGAKLVSLPLPGRGADIGRYVSFISDVCASHGLEEIVVSDELARLTGGAGLPARAHSGLGARPLARPGDSFRLVQFTSGSTDHPKAVVLDDRALGENVTAIMDLLRPRPGDVAVSWLPLAHDMGLVGMVLSSIAGMSRRHAGPSQLVLLDPMKFLRQPALWMESIDRWEGTITAAPDFGYRLAAMRRPVGDIDLSSLRVAIVGGEAVRAETLNELASTFSADGLDPRSLCPAYGMAEIGVAAAITPPEQMWRDRRLSTHALAEGSIVTPERGHPAVNLVASGPPVAGVDVDVDCGGQGGTKEGTTSQILLRSPSIGVDGTTGAGFARPDGWYETGDAGFLEDGWLYVCGRIDDYFVAHARNIYAPAVEAGVGLIPGVRPGRVTAVGLPTGHWVVVAEPSTEEPLTPSAVGELRQSIRRAAVELARVQPDDVRIVGRGSLPLTSSGKLQRNEVRRRLLADALGSFQADVGEPSGP